MKRTRKSRAPTKARGSKTVARQGKSSQRPPTPHIAAKKSSITKVPKTHLQKPAAPVKRLKKVLPVKRPARKPVAQPKKTPVKQSPQKTVLPAPVVKKIGAPKQPVTKPAPRASVPAAPKKPVPLETGTTSAPSRPEPVPLKTKKTVAPEPPSILVPRRIRVENPELLEHYLEALIFASGKAMTDDQLAALTGEPARAVHHVLEGLANAYNERQSALMIVQEGSSWRMMVRDQFVSIVRRIMPETELPRAVLETLAVIAYNHPNALQSKIVDIRGSSTYEHITELERVGFVVKAPEGRSFLLKLTEKFFEYFDVDGSSMKQLLDAVPQPTVKPVAEFQEALVPPPPVVLPKPPADRRSEGDIVAEREFLTSMEGKISSHKSRNDELDKDPMFKRSEPSPPVDAGEVTTAEPLPQPAPSEPLVTHAKPIKKK